ncbi:hypothetical protein MUP32_04475, partial [Candidatus Microgenomates bacterium]|nr:hypothetical protein [Candidatus Microgenomates bacterium]
GESKISGPATAIKYFLIDDGNHTAVALACFASDEKFDEDLIKIVNQMLSTIKFLEEASGVPKTYTNPKYPILKIIYDSSWNLNSTENQNTNVSGAIDTLLTFNKNGTILFFDVKVGTPMGAEPECFSKSEKPYTLISNNLLRYKDTTYGNYYWQGAIVKEENENKFNEYLSHFTGAFNCQKNNNCALCYTSGDFETATIRTIYPLPIDGVDYGQNKYYGASVRVYVKQDVEDQTFLKEVDKIVEESLNSSK